MKGKFPHKSRKYTQSFWKLSYTFCNRKFGNFKCRIGGTKTDPLDSFYRNFSVFTRIRWLPLKKIVCRICLTLCTSLFHVELQFIIFFFSIFKNAAKVVPKRTRVQKPTPWKKSHKMFKTDIHSQYSQTYTWGPASKHPTWNPEKEIPGKMVPWKNIHE